MKILKRIEHRKEENTYLFIWSTHETRYG